MTVHSERGSMSVLVLGLGLVAFAVAGVVVDGTRAYVYRRSLQAVADGMSTAAASEINRGAYYGSGGRTVRLDRDQATAEAERYLKLRGLEVEASMEVGSRSIGVTLDGKVATTFLGLVGIDRLRVNVSSSAAPAWPRTSSGSGP